MSDNDFLKLFKPASEIPEPDTSYFLPWNLEMLYQIEPELKEIAERNLVSRRCRFEKKRAAYEAIKNAAWELLGWYARDPRLRSKEAWECYFGYILDELNI